MKAPTLHSLVRAEMRAQNDMTADEVAAKLGRNSNVVRRAVVTLVQDEFIHVTGSRGGQKTYRAGREFADKIAPSVSYCNSAMPNGCTEYWAKHVSKMMTPARLGI
jgi:predicted transcriptional regulator